MNIGTFIDSALTNLNEKNGGDGIFESFCKELIPQVIDENFLGSSGIAAGGDGGIDGCGQTKDGKRIKYAFSIAKKYAPKIKSEIEKWDKNIYEQMVYVSNQSIRQRIKEDYYKTEPNLTIYDKQNLIEYIEKNPHLGQFIGLPFIKRAFEKRLLCDNHQLKNEEGNIPLLIPRSLTITNHGEPDTTLRSPLDICIKNKITIIEAPAGYGKTSLLKQIYLSILHSATFHIPILFTLKDYISSSNLEKQLNRALPSATFGNIKDYILLLDGYDEIIDENPKSLIKEINQLLMTPDATPHFVITVRSDHYNSSDFKLLDVKPQIASIRGFDSGNIDELLDQDQIEEAQGLKSNSFFAENSHNAFYAVSLIKFFKRNNTFATNIVNLMEDVVSNEIDLKFRNDKPSRNTLENLATFMTLHQIQELSKERHEEFGIEDFPESPKVFSFSHKNIQEYLAASKISKLNTEDLKQLITTGTKIVPYLSDMFGYILNILCTSSSTSSKFEEIVDWSLQDNPKKLILIEPDKISPDLNATIFSRILDVESDSLNVSGISDRLISFMVGNYANIKLLIDKLFPERETKDSEDDVHYTHLLCNLILFERFKSKDKILSDEDNNIIIDSFFRLIDGNDNGERISRLFYCFSYISSLPDLNYDQISILISKTIALCNLEGVFDNLCFAIINSTHNLSFDDFKILLHVALGVALGTMDNHGGTFSAIPDEVDDDFQTPILHYISIRHFQKLAEIYLRNNPETFWLIIREINNIQTKNNRFGNDLKDFHTLIFDIAFDLHLFKNHEIENATLSDFLFLQLEHMDFNYWFEKFLLIFSFGDEALWTIMTKLINSESFACHEMISVVYKRIKTTGDFQTICDYFEGNKKTKEQDFYNNLRLELPQDHPLFNDLLGILKEEEREKIESRIHDQEENTKNQEILKMKPKEDIVVLFNKDLLKQAFVSIFEYLKKDEINREKLIEHRFSKRNIEINNFVWQFLSQTLNDDHIINKTEIPLLINQIFGINWGWHLVQYASDYNLDLSRLDECRKDSIFDWIERTLNEYPMKNSEDCKYPHQQVICYLLNRIKMHKKISVDLLLEASLSDFSVKRRFTPNYEYFSIDYLEYHIESCKIIEYLLAKFAPHQSSEGQLIAFCGYLLGKSNTLLPYQKAIVKDHLISFINTHMDSRHNLEVRRLMEHSGIIIDDLSEEEIIKSLYLEDGKLKYNYASSFLLREVPENKNLDNLSLLRILRKAYNHSDGMLKVKLAEAIISRNQFADSVFKFYAKYILQSDENRISSRFWLGEIGGALSTADFQHLPHIEKLYIYALGKESDRRQAIREIASASYRDIGQKITNHSQLNKIIRSLDNVAKKTGNQYVMQHAHEIESAFIERQFSPPNWEEVLSL